MLKVGRPDSDIGYFRRQYEGSHQYEITKVDDDDGDAGDDSGDDDVGRLD